MPLILGTNSIKDTGYDVANSLRFNNDSSDHLSKNTATATNAKKFTYSVWVKRGHLNPTNDSTAQRLYQGYKDSDNRLYIQFNYSAEVIRIFGKTGGTTEIYWDSTRKFRDVSAWYHIVLSADSTLSTQADRMKVYVNNELIDSWSKTNSPSQNIDWGNQIAQSNGTLTIGADNTSSEIFDGYMSEICFIDGSALAPTDFGEFDSDSPTIWKPKDVSGLTFGNNGFYLDFENASSLGADVSGNSNNFTVNNLTAVDQSLDTCTNNSCTLSPLWNSFNQGDLSEGNLKSSMTSGAYKTNVASFGVSQGKWYWEIKITSASNVNFLLLGVTDESTNKNVDFKALTGSTVFNNTTGKMQIDGSEDGSASAKFAEADIMGIALNMDDKEISIFKNGSALHSDVTMSTTSNLVFPCHIAYTYATYVFEYNFGGTQSFTISSGNTDGNGYGNFEYAVPSGYFSLNTKNLAEFG